MTLRELFQAAKKQGKQPKELLEKIMDLRYAEQAKLQGLEN